MNYYFFDHLSFRSLKTRNFDSVTKKMKTKFSDFYYLIELLQIEYYADIPDELEFPFVAFVHAGVGHGRLADDWKKKADPEKKGWVIFVSTRPSNSSHNEDNGVFRINKDLGTVTKRLRDQNLNVASKFKESCLSSNGPDIALLVGAYGWPIKVLSRYLLEKAGMGHETEMLGAAKLSDIEVIAEYNFFAENYNDLIPITSTKLNKNVIDQFRELFAKQTPHTSNHIYFPSELGVQKRMLEHSWLQNSIINIGKEGIVDFWLDGKQWSLVEKGWQEYITAAEDFGDKFISAHSAAHLVDLVVPLTSLPQDRHKKLRKYLAEYYRKKFNLEDLQNTYKLKLKDLHSKFVSLDEIWTLPYPNGKEHVQFSVGKVVESANLLKTAMEKIPEGILIP